MTFVVSLLLLAESFASIAIGFILGRHYPARGLPTHAQVNAAREAVLERRAKL